MMKCPACNFDVGDESDTCPSCGVEFSNHFAPTRKLEDTPSFTPTRIKEAQRAPSSRDDSQKSVSGSIDDSRFVPGTIKEY